MKPIRPMTALLAGCLVTAVSALMTQMLRNSDRALPQHSWWEVLVLVVLCGALVAGGWRVRDEVKTRTQAKREAEAARRRGHDEADAHVAAAAVMNAHETLSAGVARRVLVFAQAAALGGAVLLGWYAGQALPQLQRLGVPSVRSAVLLLAALAVGGLVLCVLGFVVQRWCSIPEDER